MENFFNYMFRTDRSQKWTNDATHANCYLIQENGEWVIKMCSSLDERQRLRDEVYGNMKKKSGDVLEFYQNDIIYLSFEQDEFDVDEEGLASMLEAGKRAYLQMLRADEYDHLPNMSDDFILDSSCVFVMHVDQDGSIHLHRVFNGLYI